MGSRRKKKCNPCSEAIIAVPQGPAGPPGLNGIDGDSFLLQGRFQIDYPELRTAWSTPIELIPAPGAGKYIEIISASHKYTWEGEDFKFDGESNPYAQLNFSSSDNQDPAFFLGQLGTKDSSHVRGQCYDNSQALFENEPISYRVFTTGMTGDSLEGLGTVVVYLVYRIVDL